MRDIYQTKFGKEKGAHKMHSFRLFNHQIRLITLRHASLPTIVHT